MEDTADGTRRCKAGCMIDKLAHGLKNLIRRQPMKLNLGCGDRFIEGFVNVDVCPPCDQNQLKY